MSSPDPAAATAAKGARLPVLDGKRVRCPYCGGRFTWPAPQLRCPECGKTFRPPPGFAPPDIRQRRRVKEKIASERDRALRTMTRGGPPASAARPGGGGPHAKAAAIGAAMFLLLLGLMLSAASARHSGGSHRPLDRVAWTTNALDTLAMALAHYNADCGRYPSLDDGGLLATMIDPGQEGWAGPYATGTDNDGWNRPWRYVPPPPDSDDPPTLSSAGPDKIFDTADDLATTPDQYRLHPEFIPHDPARLGRPHRPSVRIAQ